MGLSLSLLSSAWNQIVKHYWSYGLANDVVLGAAASEGGVVRTILRTASFKRTSSFGRAGPMTVSGSDNGSSATLKGCRPDRINLNTPRSLKNLAVAGKGGSDSPRTVTPGMSRPPVPAISLPSPAILFSPRPVSELDAAAVKLQKVYKSYRTRRNLADCAVVVEELWWKALDFAALKRSSVSFFDVEKPETAVSRWARARTRAAKVGKGLSKDEKAQKLALQHWLEAIDPRHRYGHNLHMYYDVWFASESTQPFFYWLDVGDGKEVNLKKCPRTVVQRQCIQYLGPMEREAYEVVVEEGKLMFKQSGTLVETVEGSKWIFVLSTSRSLYVGQKRKGVFQHSSFLSGGATTAAGRLVAHGGVLEAIWPYSGHYHPTEENFREFISYLKEHNVDLTNVKRCAVDDDTPAINVNEEPTDSDSFKDKRYSAASSGESDGAAVVGAISTVDSDHEKTKSTVADVGEQVYSLGRRLSCKWSTGAGPRIGCVRDYPTDLQSRALEQVSLSPRVAFGPMTNYGPIPSPRPSPKVRVSPRLAYMGLPSPRMSIPEAR